MKGGHFTKVCEFGKVHGTCRCPSDNKATIVVPCDRPESHKPKPVNIDFSEITDYAPLIEDRAKTLRERFDGTISEAFADLLARTKVENILDALQQDVVDWLMDEAKTIKE